MAEANSKFKLHLLNDKIKSNSSDGGNGSMKNDYVTHEELNHAVDNLSNEIKILGKDIDVKFEKTNTKFAEQKVWFYGTAISIIIATCTIIPFLIKILDK